MKHWHVNVNVPGYLPEHDPYVFRTRAEAMTFAKQEKESILTDGWGSREGPELRAYGRDGNYDIEAPRSRTFLGLAIRVSLCHEDDCEVEE